MQSFLNDKQNDVPSIALDFKKKAKSKPNSERTNSSSSLLKTQNVKLISSNTISLLEKKKQYSQTIREKNLQKEGKKSRHQVTLEEKIHNEIEKFNAEALKISSFHSMNSNDYYSAQSKNQTQRKKSCKSFIFHPSPSKKEQKMKARDSKKQKEKLQQGSMMIQGAKDHNYNQNFSIISIAPNYAIDQTLSNQEFSVIQKIDQLSRIEKKFQIRSKQIDEFVGPFETQQQKQMQLIKKQNSTFKKQLHTFRRQNAKLKRQMEQLKKQLGVFQQRNAYLQAQSAQQFKMLQSLQIKVSSSIETLPDLQLENKCSSEKENQLNDGKLREIISNYENQLFQATNLNKKLQFRNYMLEKRLMDQTQIHKKQMAKEISIWKQRYVKARNENMRLKDSRSHMLFEMSISQQM